MIEWNKVHYCDCMDLNIGILSLPNKSIEMCLTDPKYNTNFTGEKKGLRSGLRERKYEDKMSIEDYTNWCRNWFEQIKRVCYGSILIHCGISNLNMWIADIEKPLGILYHYKEDVQS